MKPQIATFVTSLLLLGCLSKPTPWEPVSKEVGPRQDVPGEEVEPLDTREAVELTDLPVAPEDVSQEVLDIVADEIDVFDAVDDDIFAIDLLVDTNDGEAEIVDVAMDATDLSVDETDEEIPCVPECDGVDCGDDGCGGLCPPGCEIANECMEGVCQEGACEFAPVEGDVACEDGDPCTVDEHCVGGVCQSGGYALQCLGVCGDGDCTYPDNYLDCPVDCGYCGDGICGFSEVGADGGTCPKDCLAACGNGNCEGGETSEDCPADCGFCGDGICWPEELVSGCGPDCPVDCGNDICGMSETAKNCPADCATCGDDTCEGGENPFDCPEDCVSCGDGKCFPPETPQGCPADCLTPCGNGICDGVESPDSCPYDCGTQCGNGVCGALESGATCPQDCWVGCGDGECVIEEGETEGNCPVDCVVDQDGDGIPDGEDNCPVTPDPEGLDFDNDGMGDVCDADDDDDGDPDASDCSPLDPEASTLAEEICDGKDNDCDDDVDEETCDDQNPCTLDWCSGVCEHEELDESEPCLDGLEGVCAAGECVCAGSCVGKECGDDGCGGDCGNCAETLGVNWVCVNFECACTPACEEKECGDDGCGDECGTCPGEQDQCVEGLCECIPECDGVTCGEDGCGGLCTDCPVCGNGALEEDEECDDGNDVAWDGCHKCLVSEIQVNTTVAGRQAAPAVATFWDGSYVVAWEGGSDDSSLDVFVQSFSAAGEPVSDEFLVNTTTVGNQRNPAVASWGFGAFIIVWEADGQDGDGYGIYSRFFLPGGTAPGDETQVNTTFALDQINPAVAPGQGSSFLVAWQCLVDAGGIVGENYDICARAYDADPDWVDNDAMVLQYIQQDQRFPAIATWDDGEYVMVWDRGSTGQDKYDIGINFFDSDGVKLGVEFTATGQIPGDQENPGVAVADPAFLVVWQDETGDNSGDGISGRFYPTQESSGSTKQINLVELGDQQMPSVAAFQGTVNPDEFLVAWQSRETVADDWEVGGLRLDGDGNADGMEFSPHGEGAWDRAAPAVATFMDGSFVIAWESCTKSWEPAENGQDGNGCGVYVQRYEPDGTKKNK